MKPVISQTIISHPALPVFRAISALTIKIPEPIILPATNMVASIKPNDDLNPRSVVLMVLFCDYRLLVKGIEFPAWHMVRFQFLPCQCGPQHFHGQVIFLDNRVVECLVGHLPAVYEFVFDAEELQASH